MKKKELIFKLVLKKTYFSAESNTAVKYKNLGITDKFVPMAHADYLYHLFGIDEEGLYKAMMELLDVEGKCI